VQQLRISDVQDARAEDKKQSGRRKGRVRVRIASGHGTSGDAKSGCNVTWMLCPALRLTLRSDSRLTLCALGAPAHGAPLAQSIIFADGDDQRRFVKEPVKKKFSDDEGARQLARDSIPRDLAVFPTELVKAAPVTPGGFPESLQTRSSSKARVVAPAGYPDS